MLEEVKEYLRIDGSEEDNFLTSLITAAKEFIKNGADYAGDETRELYKLAVKILVTHWYENREPIGQAEQLSFSLESIFTQLKYSYVPPNAPTGLTGIVGDQFVELSWYENKESGLKGYFVYQDSVKITANPITDTTYRVEGLTNGVTYSFQVSAVNNNDIESELSTAISLTPTA